MHVLSLRSKHNLVKPPTFPSRLVRTLWRLQCPDEPMVATTVHSQPQSTLWYRTTDGFTGAVQHFESHYFTRKQPVVVLLGPLLNPFQTLHAKLPWLRELNEKGHAVYAIAHRCHTLPTSSSTQQIDCSFSTMVTEDILSALQMIEQHSNSHSVHFVSQGFGTWMTLLLMALQDQRRIESVHLFNTPHHLPSSLISTVLSFVHQDTSMQQVWVKHLSAPKFPVLLKSLSLTERSALLNSNSWLSKDWLYTLRKNRTLKTLSLTPPIQLLHSLPIHLRYPLHSYQTTSSAISHIHGSAIHHSLPKSFFPLLRTDVTLHI